MSANLSDLYDCMAANNANLKTELFKEEFHDLLSELENETNNLQKTKKSNDNDDRESSKNQTTELVEPFRTNNKDDTESLQNQTIELVEPYRTSDKINSESKLGVQNNLSHEANLFQLKKPWIYNKIATEIGVKWRRFGTGIGIRQGVMDTLQQNCNNIREIVFHMLDELEVNEFYNLESIYYKIIKSLDDDCNLSILSKNIKKAMFK